MPIRVHYDKISPYVQWGNHGAKYRFNLHSKRSFDLACQKAIRQMSAAFAHGYREKR